MKYKLTPATTSAATVVKKSVTTELTTFRGIEPSGKFIVQESFCQGKENVFSKACKKFGRMIYFERLKRQHEQTDHGIAAKKNSELRIGVLLILIRFTD